MTESKGEATEMITAELMPESIDIGTDGSNYYGPCGTLMLGNNRTDPDDSRLYGRYTTIPGIEIQTDYKGHDLPLAQMEEIRNRVKQYRVIDVEETLGSFPFTEADEDEEYQIHTWRIDYSYSIHCTEEDAKSLADYIEAMADKLETMGYDVDAHNDGDLLWGGLPEDATFQDTRDRWTKGSERI